MSPRTRLLVVRTYPRANSIYPDKPRFCSRYECSAVAAGFFRSPSCLATMLPSTPAAPRPSPSGVGCAHSLDPAYVPGVLSSCRMARYVRYARITPRKSRILLGGGMSLIFKRKFLSRTMMANHPSASSCVTKDTSLAIVNADRAWHACLVVVLSMVLRSELKLCKPKKRPV